MDLNKLDRKFLGRESPAEDVQVSRTEGSFVYDARGKKYIDFIAGWCVGNTGWGRAGIRKRGPDYVYPEYLYKPWVKLAQLLAEITPGKLQKTWLATGGSEAVDIAGFIMEPVICNLNVLVPDAEFMKRVSRMCKRYGTLLPAVCRPKSLLRRSADARSEDSGSGAGYPGEVFAVN